MFHGSNELCKARTHRRCVRAVFFGVALRQAQAVKNKYIPLILGGISMVLCAVWVMATSEIETAKEGAMAVLRRSRRDSGGGAEQLCESDYQADP